MPADPPVTPTLFRRIEALGFVAGSENPLGWVIAEAERLRAENTRLQTALAEARTDYATAQARYTAAWEALCDIGEQLHAAGHPQLLPERALRVGEGVGKVTGERDEARTRIAELERHVGSLHKTAAAGRDAEREAVVAWLWREPPGGADFADPADLADAIARGEHREGEGL